MVELDGKVVEIAKEHFGAIHRGVFDNPKLKLLIEDGLKYLAETKEKFDYIALDLPDPIGPATALYEEAFFRDCKRALAAGGVLTLHMGSPWSRPDRVKMLYGRLAKMFKIARPRSEEHTSELQSHVNLVCRLLLEKKKACQRAEEL